VTRRVAALSCCLSLFPASVVSAEDIMKTRPAPVTAAVINAAAQAGPLRTASLSKDMRSMPRAETRCAVRPAQDDGDSGSCMERHPVLAGALVGFSTVFLITYAVAHDDDEEFITVISPAAAAVVWGSVGAGVGALAGWGIDRNRDDGYRDGGGLDLTACRQ
jgi:hypothetical protein